MAAGRRVSSDAIRTRFLPTFFKRTASLPLVVVLPEPCRPAIRITEGGTTCQVQLARHALAQHVGQAVVDDLDHLIGGLHRLDDRFARRLDPGLGDEVLDDRQGDVGVEKGQAHFAQRLVHVLLGQDAAAGQPVEDACQTIAQSLKQDVPRTSVHPRATQKPKRVSPPWTITSTGGLAALVWIGCLCPEALTLLEDEHRPAGRGGGGRVWRCAGRGG